MNLLRPEVDVVAELQWFAGENFKFQAIFREYLLINEKNHPVHKNFKNSSWSKPNFLPGLKYFLAQHLVETQICTLSKIFLGQKVDPESRHVPV